MNKMLRQPIVSVLGHVDHGKTLLLDKIRGTAIVKKEAGGITQAIGASIIPIGTIKSICGDLLKSIKNLNIPGLLFIDTPGHAAFVNLRKRGGNLADIAVLVIDVKEGLMPQTLESIEILRSYKTPFIIAANKIDLIQGWKKQNELLLKNIEAQYPQTQQALDTKLYEIVGKIYEIGLQADRFDRVEDFTKQIAIVPISALTGEGIKELLMVLTGLAQKFLEQNLQVNMESPAKGTVLEVKEQKGLGKVLDVIIYDGVLKVGDQVIIGGLGTPVITKVKLLFEPEPHTEMRIEKKAFKSVKHVNASTGVRVVAPDIDNVIGGMPLQVVKNDLEELKEKVMQEIEGVMFESEEEGIIIKADTLGSLEAMMFLLKEKNVPVKKASIGPVNKKDVIDAEGLKEKNPLNGVILGFNIPPPDEKIISIKVIIHDVIYKVIEDYEAWVEGQKKNLETQALESLTKPCKIELLKGYTFRQSNPAVIGCNILLGTLESNISLINLQGKEITSVKAIQKEQETVEKAEKNDQLAVSLTGVIIGRQIKEGDILYSAISEEEFRKYKDNKGLLRADYKEALKEIANIMREHNPVWGV
ncbi:translation initiation factor IF-2 [archaeon]|nr:translation initiation factor IF-2 [archaeon]